MVGRANFLTILLHPFPSASDLYAPLLDYYITPHPYSSHYRWPPCTYTSILHQPSTSNNHCWWFLYPWSYHIKLLLVHPAAFFDHVTPITPPPTCHDSSILQCLGREATSSMFEVPIRILASHGMIFSRNGRRTISYLHHQWEGLRTNGTKRCLRFVYASLMVSWDQWSSGRGERPLLHYLFLSLLFYFFHFVLWKVDLPTKNNHQAPMSAFIKVRITKQNVWQWRIDHYARRMHNGLTKN